MERLPNELVVKIFSYFHPIYENLARHAMVCRKWSEIIESTALLWKHIHLDDNRHNSPNMETEYRKVLCDCLLRFGRFVHCIRAEEETFFTMYEVRRLLPSLESLRSLDVPSLSWNSTLVKSLKCAPVLRNLTIDDHRALFAKWCKTENDIALLPRLHKRGVRIRDLATFAKKLPKLETLKLSLNIYKLCSDDLVAVLDQLHLRELNLECMPYGLKDVKYHQLIQMTPLRRLALSKHAQILTHLEIRCLPISACNLGFFLKQFTSLESLVVGFNGAADAIAPRQLSLESSSLVIFMLDGLPSSRIEELKCVMPRLEVVAISECENLLLFELLATEVLFVIIKENCRLQKITGSCDKIQTLHLLDCPSLSYDNFRAFLAENPTIERMELITEWAELRLENKHCKSLTKLAIRETALSLTCVQLNCPTLRIFKCSGDLTPRKGVFAALVGGCEFHINSNHIKKFQINDISHLRRVNVKCLSIELIQIGGLQSFHRPLDLEVRAGQRIESMSLNRVALGSIEIQTPVVHSVILQHCALAFGNVKCKMQFRCDAVGSLSLMNCNKIKKFSLRVPRVSNLVIDSCSRLRQLELNVTRLKHIRVTDCPLLEPINEMVSGKEQRKHASVADYPPLEPLNKLVFSHSVQTCDTKSNL